MKKSFNLPRSVIAFLRTGKQLQYNESRCEAGRVGLKAFDQLSIGEVWIGTNAPDDPHHNQDGYYAIPAISLSGSCAAYNPEFILLWLPQDRLFGTWDCDHWVLTVFPNATWNDIVADPLTYLNSQWYPALGGGIPFQPWHKYKLKPGNPF